MKRTAFEILLILILSLLLSLAFNAVSPTPVKLFHAKPAKKTGLEPEEWGSNAGRA